MRRFGGSSVCEILDFRKGTDLAIRLINQVRSALEVLRIRCVCCGLQQGAERRPTPAGELSLSVTQRWQVDVRDKPADIPANLIFLFASKDLPVVSRPAFALRFLIWRKSIREPRTHWIALNEGVAKRREDRRIILNVGEFDRNLDDVTFSHRIPALGAGIELIREVASLEFTLSRGERRI